jgi:hypothetical protein
MGSARRAWQQRGGVGDGRTDWAGSRAVRRPRLASGSFFISTAPADEERGWAGG